MQAISYALCLLCVYRVSMYTTNIWLIWGKFREESGSEAATSVKKFRSPSPGQGLRCCQPGKAAFLCSVVYNSYIIEEFHQPTRWINPPYLQLGKFEYARHEYHYVFCHAMLPEFPNWKMSIVCFYSNVCYRGSCCEDFPWRRNVSYLHTVVVYATEQRSIEFWRTQDESFMTFRSFLSVKFRLFSQEYVEHLHRFAWYYNIPKHFPVGLKVHWHEKTHLGERGN